MKKLLYLPLLALLLSGCSSNSLRAEALPDTDLDDLLVSYNVNGYTKKTEFSANLDASLFHANCNGKTRATYYNASENALLMGDYDGTFTNINSGYKNREGGIQHFRYNGEGNYFTNITEDWTFDGQSVGVYYPTLTSLAALIEQESWSYSDNTFTYTFGAITLTEGEYNDQVLKNFQYFAAPMLLQTTSIDWGNVQVKEETNYLSIKLSSKTELISEAKVYKGIQ